MKNVYRLKTDIDIKPLYNEIDMKNGWQKWSPNMSGHGTAFKYSSRQSLLRHKDSSPTEVYSNYKKLHKFLSEFEDIYGGKVIKASYYIIPVGRKISKHADLGLEKRFEEADRFHLVISGSYVYTVEAERNIFKEGELWWFDNQKQHEGRNNNTIDRINLVIDVENCNWRETI
tara:strand:- start:15 stop:533 length:519 start_codon:yes stop_codon:yes gene_type:complete